MGLRPQVAVPSYLMPGNWSLASSSWVGRSATAAGEREEVPDEVGRQGGRTACCWRVAAQLVGVGVGMVVLGFQPGEQVPQVALLGVRAAPGVGGVVVVEKLFRSAVSQAVKSPSIFFWVIHASSARAAFA